MMARAAFAAKIGLLFAAGVGCARKSPSTGAPDGKDNQEYLEPRQPSASYLRLRKIVDGIRLIDGHQHLVSESDWLAKENSLFRLMSAYLDSDLVSAGKRMPPGDASAQTRWLAISEFWPVTQFTGYAQAMRIAARDLYGHDISDATWRALDDQIRERSKAPGYYHRAARPVNLCCISLSAFHSNRSKSFEKMCRIRRRTLSVSLLKRDRLVSPTNERTVNL